MSNLKNQIAFAGGNAEIWSHGTAKYDDEAGTIQVNTNSISGMTDEALYSHQRMLLTKMRGWNLQSEAGVDTFTSPQQVAKQKAADSSKESAEMLKKLRAHLPKDRSSLWNSEGVVKSNSEGEEGVYLDLTKHEDQSYITDRVFRDLDYLRKAGWTTAFCRTGALWVHVFPPVAQPTYKTAKVALAGILGDEPWIEQGVESHRGEVYFHADRMSEMDFRRAVQACYEMAGKKGWKGSQPMRSFLQPLTGQTEYDRAVFVASERVMQDA